MLSSKRKELKQNVRENGLLNEVLADYNKHNHDIVNQKQEQIDLLKTLHEYIGSVSNHNNNIHRASTLMKESKTDQREILKEINHLKQEIEGLTE